MLLRLLVLLGGLSMIVGVSGARPADPEVAEAAGEVRMLSQRIVRTYAQVGLGVTPAIAAEQMNDALQRFGAAVDRLQGGTGAEGGGAPALRTLVAECEALTAAIRSAPTRDAAVRLSQLSVRVLEAAAPLAGASDATPSLRTAIVMASQQRMLSQRIAKAYMLLSWGEPSPALRGELAAAVAEFSGNLALLAGRVDNGAAIRTELDELGLQWAWLEVALAADGTLPYRLVVAEAADSILASADRLVRLYGGLDETTSRTVPPKE